MAADTVDLQPSFRKAVEAMIAASGGRLYFTSGYRSDQQQAQLYAAAVQKYGAANAGRYVAPPGHSNHNRGLAADIGGDLDLLKQLAPQFGLELPMSWEPWHVEPVGLRTQSGTSAQAYPSSQPGTVNPTQDATLNSQPENLFATMSAILNGTMIANAAEGKMTGDTGVNQGMSGQQTGGGAGGGAQTVGGPGAAAHGSVNPADLYKQLRAQGVDPVHAAALVAIAGRESGYNPGAFNGNASTGDRSFGLFQINKLNGMHSQYSDQSLLTVPGSVAAAADMVKSGGLQPWGGYKGVSWSHGINSATLAGAAAASGGEVTLAQLEGLQ